MVDILHCEELNAGSQKDVDLFFMEVAKAVLGTDEVWPSFQKGTNYPAVVYYITGSESVQTLKTQKDLTYTLRYEVRSNKFRETVELDRRIRQKLSKPDDPNQLGRLVSVQGVFDDPSDEMPSPDQTRQFIADSVQLR